jgi:hypothetical protein
MMGSSLTDIQYENIFRFLLSIRPGECVIGTKLPRETHVLLTVPCFLPLSCMIIAGVAIGKIIIDNLVLLKGIDIPR